MYGLAKCALVLCAAVAASSFNLEPLHVVFHYFSRANAQQSEPLLPNMNSIQNSNFGLDRRTICTIHGHNESVNGNFNAFVVPAELSAVDVNVIAVDWSPGSSMYSVGLANAPQAGEVIASFFNILINTFGYNPSLIRFVGVGLGAHITGIAAKQINGVVPHIVALDPSLVGWTHHPDILSRDDAAVVEVLHTTAGFMGYDYPLGDIDHYPNGGSSQSGCFADVSCSHIYSYVFYAESITAEVNNGQNFVATQCTDYEQAITGICNGDEEDSIIFGGTAVKQPVQERHVYTFQTNFVPPFARGP